MSFESMGNTDSLRCTNLESNRITGRGSLKEHRGTITTRNEAVGIEEFFFLEGTVAIGM